MSTYWNRERRVSLVATRQEIVLSTVCVCPPIPIRNFDWFACDDNTYDGGDEHPVSGEGRTEQEAIDCLFDRLLEESDTRKMAKRTSGDGSMSTRYQEFLEQAEKLPMKRSDFAMDLRHHDLLQRTLANAAASMVRYCGVCGREIGPGEESYLCTDKTNSAVRVCEGCKAER